jgi:DNA invertase Pin-like site-specific DNA recombinase
MPVIGYARVSTTDQDLSIQQAALKAAGCEVIRAEKRSGTTTEGRAELKIVLDFLREGDVLMVTRIDRLARSIGDLQDIVRAVRARGAVLKATEQPIDTSTAAGKCFLDMLGVFAEFETNLRRERQLEGIAKAKARGVYKGRKASIDPARVKQLKADGLGPTEIARALKIGRASVYRAFGANRSKRQLLMTAGGEAHFTIRSLGKARGGRKQSAGRKAKGRPEPPPAVTRRFPIGMRFRRRRYAA